jgi:putative transposase
MSRRVNFQLNDEQRAEIEQAINHAVQPEVRQRAIAIRMLHLGHKPEAVAQVVLVSANTVWTWHRRYRQDGLDGLQDQPRSGRPNKADADYIAQLEQLLDTDPRTLGLPFTIWTINRLRLYLAEQTHVLLSYTRFRALLSRLNYRWKQPKHDLTHLQDQGAQETTRAILDWLKKHPLPRRRRSPAPLCGRNNPEPTSAFTALLDETRSA